MWKDGEVDDEGLHGGHVCGGHEVGSGEGLLCLESAVGEEVGSRGVQCGGCFGFVEGGECCEGDGGYESLIWRCGLGVYVGHDGFHAWNVEDLDEGIYSLDVGLPDE